MSKGLALVQRVAEIREQQSLRELAEAVQAQRSAELALSEVQHSQADWRERLQRWVVDGTQVANLADGQAHIRALDVQIADVTETVQERQQILIERQSQWTESRRYRQAIEAVCSRRAQQQKRLQERREQQTLNDLYRPGRRDH